MLDAWRDDGVRNASGRRGGHGGIPGCYKLGETTVGEVLVAKEVVTVVALGAGGLERQRCAKCL